MQLQNKNKHFWKWKDMTKCVYNLKITKQTIFFFVATIFYVKQIIIQLKITKFKINSHRQSLKLVGIYLPSLVFSHGQLYVTISRGASRDW
jgi:hypothetical protein